MTAKQYQHERRRRGTKPEVAAALKIHPYTINKRERGDLRVNEEARLALLTLPLLADGGLAPEAKTGRPKKIKHRKSNCDHGF